MMAEYTDLYNEAARVTRGGPIRRMYQRTIWSQRILYQLDAYWAEHTPSGLSAIRHTWIMELVQSIIQRDDCEEWLADRKSREDYTHRMKTEDRMAELAPVSGLARIMFTSTVDKEWVNPTMKAYWFALSWAPREREIPLVESTILSTGHHLSVFPY